MLRVMLVGCGRWGRHYVRLLYETPTAQLVRVSDLESAGRETVARYNPDIPYGPDFGAVYEYDAVIIATPAATHRSLTGLFLRRGKHVLCEKPLCLSAGRAASLHAMARQRGLALRTGYTYLHNPLVRFMIDDIGKGVVGRVRSMFFRQAGPGPVRTDVDVIFDRAAHGISVFNAWAGSAPIVTTAMGCDPGPAEATLTMLYPDDVLGTVSVGWQTPKKECFGWANGDKGTLWFDDYLKVGFLYTESETSAYSVPDVGPLALQLRDFIDAIKKGWPNHEKTDRDVMVTLDAARQSFLACGEPIMIKGVAP